MSKKSIMQLMGLQARGGDAKAPAGDGAEQSGASAAERLGRALLDTLGLADDVNEDELVEAVLGEWANRDESGEAGEADEADEAGEPLYDGTEDEPGYDERGYDERGSDERGSDEPEEDDVPFGRVRRPVPIRTAGAASAPVDYADMSTEQFRELKKLLKKAAADGKRIKL